MTAPLVALLISCTALASGDVPLSAADVQGLFYDALHGGPSTVADVQRAYARLIGRLDESPSGVVASGKNVSVVDLDPKSVQAETNSEAPIQHYFEVLGEGPRPLRVYVPVTAESGEMEVYRRASPGLYVRLRQPPARSGTSVSFEANAPGQFVVREVDEYSYAGADALKLSCPQEVSEDPAAKAAWSLFRVEPELITGPVPLILVAGAGTDRWADFIHWAAHSPEAEALRREYQIWNFFHPSEGINAAVGFSSAYPGFEESIAAYLERFIVSAMSGGVETDGVLYRFPDGPYSIVTHSHGGLAARAFMKNFPEQAERVLGVVTINAPHLGTPWGTPDWISHTLTSLGFSGANWIGRLLEATGGQFYLYCWLSMDRQSDLDLGWGNFDAAGGYGLPYEDFKVLRSPGGLVRKTVSPRDANQTGARSLPGYDDDSFTPVQPLPTYCGGLEEIMPDEREDLHLDKFFLYGSYMLKSESLIMQVLHSLTSTQNKWQMAFETIGINLANPLMDIVATEGTDLPLGAYRLNDGACPLRSMLMLDGAEDDLLYKTTEVLGWRVPVYPLQPRMDLIEKHTLANPDRLRILRGWNHLETVTGRYNPATGQSRIFSMVAEDLVSVLPAE
ncbi:MAG: hypothetical protein GWP08_00620 [Nitrospiraceae bacterium]|nr:hypothetical protein [Nitrospiraceae bacterium]